MVTRLNDTDYAVLSVFDYAERPLWEERVHQRLDEYREELPIEEPVSQKEVEKRLDSLEDDEYLEKVIASPDPLEEAMIAAYVLTKKGNRLF